jgi:phage tail sheath protein FI
MSLTYALRGYFANGGKVAYVVRVSGDDDQFARSAVWDLGPELKRVREDGSTAARTATDLPSRFRIVAGSPGSWGETVIVTVRVNLVTGSQKFVTQPKTSSDSLSDAGQPGRLARKLVVDLTITATNEPDEYILGLDPALSALDEQAGLGTTMIHRLEQESKLVRLVPVDPGDDQTANASNTFTLTLDHPAPANAKRSSLSEYLEAVQLLGDEQEVSLLAVPALHEDLDDAAEQWQVVRALLDQAASLYDRQVLVDPPQVVPDAIGYEQFVTDLRDLAEVDSQWKAAALYAPWLWVPDPLGGTAKPLRAVPPSGHVAGIISRLDRDRGSHYTPANAPMLDAVELDASFAPADDGRIAAAGVNLIICRPAYGLMVWGGRTLDPRRASMYLAHRRLVHRLVRTFRRVAEPIVFEANGPQLRLVLARAVTSVLLDAFRVGALVGDRPEDAFQVQCDDETNPPEMVDLGFAVCKVSVAPAVPMEFITFRVALSETKQLEVFDS